MDDPVHPGLAINTLTSGNNGCELMSGLTNMSNLVDDKSHDVYVVGAYLIVTKK